MPVAPATTEPTIADAFRALGDPVRCAIVEHLSASGDVTVNELAALFPISLQAVSKHIKVLRAAGVVTQHRQGRHRPVRLRPESVTRTTTWLDDRLRQLEERYRRLDEVLADIQTGDHR